MKVDLTTHLCGIKMSNPILTASGTSGYGQELAQFYDLSVFGAFTVKSLTLAKRAGNPTPRIAECASGVLNSIGIQSEGVKHFIRKDLPMLRQYDVPVIVSIAGLSVDEFPRVAAVLEPEEGISAIEVNISCPNLEAGGSSFGADPEVSYRIMQKVKSVTRRPVIAKLTPNVTDIAAVARSVEEGGADAVSLINTLGGMAIDIETRKPKLANIFGGLSGPAVKPIGVKMVWQVYQAVRLPIIGIGGIMTWEDAVEYILAGATAVGLGAVLFQNPWIVLDIIEGIRRYMERKGVSRLDDIRGNVLLPDVPV
jgi:dihydroorotate dehydrogenase (NAD+) catalytic subunit